MTEKSSCHLSVAEFLTDCIAASEKSQREISEECGFENPNIITMFKKGRTKVPLNRIAPLAKALDVEPALLFRLTMQEYAPDLWESIEDIMKSTVMTPSELRLLRSIRAVIEGKTTVPVIFGRDVMITIEPLAIK